MSQSHSEKRSHEAISSRSSASNGDQDDSINAVPNPFATPVGHSGAQTPNPEATGYSLPTSRAPSDADGSGSSTSYQYFPRGEYFRSRRIQKGEIHRPWLDKKDPREKWVTIIPLIGLFLGVCITGVLVWDGIRSVAKHSYCEVFSDDFSSWNSKVWTKEVELGGYG